MKRFFVFLLGVSVLFSCSVWATQVSPIPACGYKAQGNITEQYGKLGFDNNGNTYRYVYNNSTAAAIKGYPAFYVATAGNSYTVKTSYEATTDLEKFAGIWYCDESGSPAIAKSTYGWLQVAGICWASVEGTTDIGADDLLIGTYVYAPAGKVLVKGRDALTSLTESGITQEVGRTVPGAYAIDAFTSDAAGTTEVFLRGLY